MEYGTVPVKLFPERSLHAKFYMRPKLDYYFYIIRMDELHVRNDSQSLKIRWKIIRNITASKVIVARIAAGIHVRLELRHKITFCFCKHQRMAL
jgi:hypothetical protein